jgi:hypothetical protein
LGPGFKYHVVTVAAIFFALTIGLVVGSLYVSPQLADRQTRAIRDLQSTLKSDITQQREQIDRYREFVSQTKPLLLRKKLENRTVAILHLGDYPEAANAVRDALTLAGAKILSETRIERTLNDLDESVLPLLAKLHAEDVRIPETRAEFFRFLSLVLSGAAFQPGELIEPLVRERLIEIEGDNRYDVPVRLFVIIAGSRLDTDRTRQIDAPLIQALIQQKLTVVACEPQEIAISDFPSYRLQNFELPLVDRVDTDMGGCALVYALRGEKVFAVSP